MFFSLLKFLVTEEVICKKDMVHLLPFTCNMKKKNPQVSHVLLDSLFVVFQRLSNSDISPHDPYMHISKMSLIFSQQNIQPSFGTDHFCISKQ